MSHSAFPVRLLAVLLISVLLGACDSDSGSSDDRPEGLYHLKTINGSALPYSWTVVDTLNLQDRTIISSATIELGEGGAFHHVLEWGTERFGTNFISSHTLDESGTWEIIDNELKVYWPEYGSIFFEPYVSDGAIDLRINWYPDIDLHMHFEK